VKRVLIIEDDPDLRDALVRLLQSEGYLVSQARDGWDGLSQAEAHLPHLILLDLFMPRMTGWEFLAAQRKQDALADIPVIVLSTFPLKVGDLLEGIAARFAKPFDVMDLLGAVEQHARA
jgi:CheY-like chemotaxis protein